MLKITLNALNGFLCVAIFVGSETEICPVTRVRAW